MCERAVVSMKWTSPIALRFRLAPVLVASAVLVVPACGGKSRVSGASTTGTSTGSATGSATGASAGAANTGSAAGAGGSAGAPSGSAGGLPWSGASSDAGASGSDGTCVGPTQYVNGAGACVCATNAYKRAPGGTTGLDAGPCACESDLPTICGFDAGVPAMCVDTTLDPANCGGCWSQCKPNAACNASACGAEPTTLVPPTPGCVSMRVVYDSGNIYWADMGHGTISSIPAGGGVVTTIASRQPIAAVEAPGGPLLWPAHNPFATALLARAGTVYWVGASTAGGMGTTLMSASAGTPPTTLLAMSMDPAPSPISAAPDASFPIETPGQPPPINAIALSSDGSTLYFAAGTRFYSIPSTGAGPLTYVGYTSGPEHAEATALAAGDGYLYDLTNLAGSVELQNLTTMCDPDAAISQVCPVRTAYGQPELVYDTLVLRGNFLYSGANTSVRQSNVAAAIDGGLLNVNFASSVFGADVTGFAMGSQFAYFGEPTMGTVCSQDHSTACAPDPAQGFADACPEISPPGQTCVTLGYIEKAPFPTASNQAANATVIARGQSTPTSFAVDGTNVYWTTTNCDINFIADSPQ